MRTARVCATLQACINLEQGSEPLSEGNTASSKSTWTATDRAEVASEVHPWVRSLKELKEQNETPNTVKHLGLRGHGWQVQLTAGKRRGRNGTNGTKELR